MGNPYPAALVDANGVERLAGLLDFTDPANQPGGGGVQTREVLNGDNVTIADNASAPLTWNRKLAGDALLDLSTPAAPVVVDAGVYAVFVEVVSASAVTAGGQMQLLLELDQAGADVGLGKTSPPSTTGAPQLDDALGFVWFIPAGGAIVLTVTSKDGAGPVDYALLTANVQRLN